MASSYLQLIRFATLMSLVIAPSRPVLAQDLAQGAQSETFAQSGVMGIRSANKFVFKYKERFNTYDDQLQMGLSKGWLTEDEANRFKNELSRLRALELAIEKKGYPKEDVGSLDKQVTQFNVDFTRAANKPKPAAEKDNAGGNTDKAGTPPAPATAPSSSGAASNKASAGDAAPKPSGSPKEKGAP